MVSKNLPLLSSFLKFDRKCSELGPPLITKLDLPLESDNAFPHQFDDTLKKRQMKHPNIVNVVDKILYLIGQQGTSYRGTKETAASSDTL